MGAVRKKIAAERVSCAEIMKRYPAMRTAVRARILRGEWDDIGLSRSLLIADAFGLDLATDIVNPTPAVPVPAPAPRRTGPTLAQVLEQARTAQQHRRKPRSAWAMGDLFGIAA